MPATYIQPTIDDFEQVFGTAGKNGKKAFSLHTPKFTEAFYICTIRETSAGRVCVKVLTSIAARRTGARAVGKDAIRASLIWIDNDGWQRGLGKEKRINRCAGKGKTALDIVRRALDRARDVASSRGKLPACKLCNRPMVLRVANKTNKVFYGCFGWQPQDEGCNGTNWHVTAEEAEKALASKKPKNPAV